MVKNPYTLPWSHTPRSIVHQAVVNNASRHRCEPWRTRGFAKFFVQCTVCNEVLFIHAHVTLEYFNFKRENRFKRFAVYFYCFSDNFCQATAGGNGSDPHGGMIWIIMIILPSTTHSISERIPIYFKWNMLVNTISKTLWWPSLVHPRAYVDPLQKDRYP